MASRKCGTKHLLPVLPSTQRYTNLRRYVIECSTPPFSLVEPITAWLRVLFDREKGKFVVWNKMTGRFIIERIYSWDNSDDSYLKTFLTLSISFTRLLIRTCVNAAADLAPSIDRIQTRRRTMNNNTSVLSNEIVLGGLKTRIELLKDGCSRAQKKMENKVSEISMVDKDIGQTEFELSEYRSKIKKVNELWKEREIDIEKLKWSQEKASVILECNRRKYELQSKTMNIIRQNYSSLTTRAFKTVRQETVNKIINNEINNLVERKKELENELIRLQKIGAENENHLIEARKKLVTTKERGETVLRLEKKLQESEALRSNAMTKLNNLKISGFVNLDNSELSSNVDQKFE